ncbi:MAG: hypothetical protein ACXWAT_13590 [Methylobacter sp.]
MNIDSDIHALEGKNFEKNLPHKRAKLILAIAALFALCSCTKSSTPRLDAKFDSDASGSPAIFPAPNPPSDMLSYTTLQQLTSSVVSDPAGGQWLRITPSAAFLTAPDYRKRALIITSEQFTTSPLAQIRGHLRLRLDGLGGLTVGFLPMQGNQSPDFIGAISLNNYHQTGGGVTGQLFLLNGFTRNQVENPFLLSPASGSLLSTPAPGTAFDIFWSIDQPSRTFSVSTPSIPGNQFQSTTFPASSAAGIATTPIQQLSLWVWLEQPSSGTVAFVDNLFAEEYK